MKLPSPLLGATFLSRANRFACWVEAGEEIYAWLHNSGRLEWLVPGKGVFLHRVASTKRKTKYDLLLVDLGGTLVSVDTARPPRLIEEALLSGKLAPFRGYRPVQREVWLGKKRLDLLLSKEGEELYLEVKSVTLVEKGVARFPDAPTLRGREHLEELMRLVAEGHKAAIAFVVQRPDALALSPNRRTDPAFADALVRAKAKGVGVHAFRCRVGLGEMAIEREIPVRL